VAGAGWYDEPRKILTSSGWSFTADSRGLKRLNRFTAPPR
jgi:hypothetical protein